jgi:hypothetical protein
VKTVQKDQTWLDHVGRSPVSLTHLTIIAFGFGPIHFSPIYLTNWTFDTPTCSQDIDIIGGFDFNAPAELAMMSQDAMLPNNSGLVPVNRTADDFRAFFNPTSHFGTLASMNTLGYPLDQQNAMAIDQNHEKDDFGGIGMCHFRCQDEDDMSSISSYNQESLFDYSPSESNATTIVGSSALQQELTYTNVEHMLAVLKAERGKCLGELRGLDAALETIDQLANRKDRRWGN